jgi:RNA polymerase sigma-70 factor (ECF subfamily)
MHVVGQTIAPAETIPFAPDRSRVPVPSRDLLSSFWQEIAPELSRFIKALGIDAHRAEDVLHEVYLAAWTKSPTVLDREGLRKWLYRVTANRCHLDQRRRARWKVAFDGLSRVWRQGAAASDGVSQQEEMQLVRRAIRDLAPLQQSIVVMRYYCEMDSKEIGQILELTDSTVRSHLRLARQRLADILRPCGGEEDE